MKLKLFVLIFMMTTVFVFSQNKSYWAKQSPSKSYSVKQHLQDLNLPQLFSVNFDAIASELSNVPNRSEIGRTNGLSMGFPNADGKMEFFSVYEASTMHPELQARFPEIKSYVGQGITNPEAIIRFSVSPVGIHTMLKEPGKPMTFIEPYASDLTAYAVFTRDQYSSRDRDFECEVTAAMQNSNEFGGYALRNADDSLLRTYRLAVAATGEYTQYHGGTKALALAAMNATLTRVNGIFENDFNVTLQLIPNNDTVIYTNPSNDPFTTTGSFNNQLQSTLTNLIGEANYDVGHLFANLQNNGNAGCIGCVCVNNQKGRGWTSHTVPEGDPFDVDYVAHELGHQFGANHTWTHGGNEGTGAQMEPGSGSTIMGYAGITGVNTDVQMNSDPYFHAISIQQVTNYIKSRSCQTNTNTGNAVPVVDAGSNYTIPRATPFVLSGSATDANTSDVLTYNWEQFDQNSASTTLPSPNSTTGVAFRSFIPTTDTKRYFPRLETVKTGATSWKWEAVPNVNRNLNFRLTVRDNRPGGGTNNSDDVVVSVTTAAGPFVLTSPNTNIIWTVGSAQNVTWNVAGTTGNGVNASAVDVFLSTDGGDTYPIALATGVPNNGSVSVVVPNNVGTQNRVMVKGSNHIFFDISNANFTIEGQVECNIAIPQDIAISNLGSSNATIGWTAIPGATYDVRYRPTGSTTWNSIQNIVGVSTEIAGLQPLTQYEAQIRSSCPNNDVSEYSSSIIFKTLEVQLNYCASQSNNVNDEYIGNVQLNTINNTSGGQFYSDFTNISTSLAKGISYTISITPIWTGSVFNEGYAVWIDLNRDGDFDDAGEQVFTRSATNQSPVSGSFTIPEAAVEGATRMRVSMKYNAIPTACESFTWGEVEDYTVIIEGSGPDVTVPTAPTNLTASGTTQTTTNLSWNASTDNVGVTGYDVYQAGVLIASVTTTNYQVTGLSANTNYTFFVRAKDAAGNVSSNSNIANVTTLPPPDTTAPSTPTNLSASNITQTTVDLSWTASTDNVGVVAYQVYLNGTLLGSTAGTSVQITGLSPNTTYQFFVVAVDAAENSSQQSNVAQATTLVNSIVYCNSQGNNSSTEWIQRVQLGGINNNSGNNGGYADFTATSTNLVKGSSNSIVITPGRTSTRRREAYRVWIDYNQDGDFNDSGELVYNRTRTTASSVSGSFTIPTSAINGATRMRVSMKYNASPTSCETFSNGEVEDYTVFIVNSAKEDIVDSIFEGDNISLILFPNPVGNSELNIKLAGMEATEIRVYNAIGQLVIKQAYSNILQVDKLEAGIYLLQITSENQSITKRFVKK